MITCLCLLWAHKRSQSSNLDHRLVMDLSGLIMISGFLGARLTHVVLEEPFWYLDHPLQILQIWQGGFVFFGGLITSLATAIYYLSLKNQLSRFWEVADFFAPIISLGHALGRISCLVAGCCFGKMTNLPWAINSRHPTQIYLSIWEFAILALLLYLSHRRKLITGQLFLAWIFLHCLGRFWTEFLRDDDRGPILFLRFSSWMGLIGVLLSLIFFWRISSQKTTKSAFGT